MAQATSSCRTFHLGKYTVVAWHKSAGFFRETIRVGESHSNLVQFNIPLEADEPGKEMARR